MSRLLSSAYGSVGSLFSTRFARCLKLKPFTGYLPPGTAGGSKPRSKAAVFRPPPQPVKEPQSQLRRRERMCEGKPSGLPFAYKSPARRRRKCRKCQIFDTSLQTGNKSPDAVRAFFDSLTAFPHGSPCGNAVCRVYAQPRGRSTDVPKKNGSGSSASGKVRRAMRHMARAWIRSCHKKRRSTLRRLHSSS